MTTGRIATDVAAIGAAASAPPGEQTIESLEVAAYRVPTDEPESDGTLQWDGTTMVAVHVGAGETRGFGFSYADVSTARLIRSALQSCVIGGPALSPPAMHAQMVARLRNIGHPGIGAMAISAVDLALWDLKARLLNLPLCTLLGAVRDSVPIYGSGGFTSYTPGELQAQLGEWVGQGISNVKMKIGRNPDDDPRRVRSARAAIGDEVGLFVDANGAYAAQQAVELGWRMRSESGISWYEEPRPSDDIAGLRFVRDHGPPGLEISAGEYGYTINDFRTLLAAGAVDVLQADITRCGGVTGMLKVDALCQAFHTPLSTHCAPAAHLHVAAALPTVRHMEYFHDHVRIEALLLDGAATPTDGALRPDRSAPGHGLSLRSADAERMRVEI